MKRHFAGKKKSGHTCIEKLIYLISNEGNANEKHKILLASTRLETI